MRTFREVVGDPIGDAVSLGIFDTPLVSVGDLDADGGGDDDKLKLLLLATGTGIDLFLITPVIIGLVDESSFSILSRSG